jgi:hypothetical protein
MGRDGGKITPKLTKAQQAQVNEWLAREAAAASERERWRRAIDRANAIRDGLIPPPWAEKLLLKEPTPQSKLGRRLGWKERHVLPILCKYFPPDGKPQSLSPQEIQKIRNDFAKQFKGESVSAKTVRRSAGLLPRD